MPRGRDSSFAPKIVAKRQRRLTGVDELVAEPGRAQRLSDAESRPSAAHRAAGQARSFRVRRALIIMASASETLEPTIARLVATDENSVRDVIHLFNQKGPAAQDTR